MAKSVPRNCFSQLLMYNNHLSVLNSDLFFLTCLQLSQISSRLGLDGCSVLICKSSQPGLNSLLLVGFRSAPCMFILGTRIKGEHYLRKLLTNLLGAVDYPGHLLPMAMAVAPESRQKL